MVHPAEIKEHGVVFKLYHLCIQKVKYLIRYRWNSIQRVRNGFNPLNSPKT